MVSMQVVKNITYLFFSRNFKLSIWMAEISQILTWINSFSIIYVNASVYKEASSPTNSSFPTPTKNIISGSLRNTCQNIEIYHLNHKRINNNPKKKTIVFTCLNNMTAWKQLLFHQFTTQTHVHHKHIQRSNFHGMSRGPIGNKCKIPLTQHEGAKSRNLSTAHARDVVGPSQCVWPQIWYFSHIIIFIIW